MAELSNGKDAQGRLVDPVTLARLKGVLLIILEQF